MIQLDEEKLRGRQDDAHEVILQPCEGPGLFLCGCFSFETLGRVGLESDQKGLELLLYVFPFDHLDEEVYHMAPEKLNVLAFVECFGSSISLKVVQVLDHPLDGIFDAFEPSTLEELNHHDTVGVAAKEDLVELGESSRELAVVAHHADIIVFIGHFLVLTLHLHPAEVQELLSDQPTYHLVELKHVKVLVRLKIYGLLAIQIA